MSDLGMRVRLRYAPEAIARGCPPEVVMRNVGEVHYRYPTLSGPRVAFESDVHMTGAAFALDDVAEFETRAETCVAESF